MPIKPENRHRYPPDWPQVRERILRRANYRCEHSCCHAFQYAVGRWVKIDGVMRWLPVEGNVPCRSRQDRQFNAAGLGSHPGGRPWTYADARAFQAKWEWNGDPPIVIVLTVAHLDHQPENCADDNLRALCQRHHLAHDHQHHLASAQATRRARAGTLELF